MQSSPAAAAAQRAACESMRNQPVRPVTAAPELTVSAGEHACMRLGCAQVRLHILGDRSPCTHSGALIEHGIDNFASTRSCRRAVGPLVRRMREMRKL